MLIKLFVVATLLLIALYVFAAAEQSGQSLPRHVLVGHSSQNARRSFYVAAACYVCAGACVLVEAAVTAIALAVVGLLAAGVGAVISRR